MINSFKKWILFPLLLIFLIPGCSQKKYDLKKWGWQDYREPYFLTYPIYEDKSQVISVDLPGEFIQSSTETTTLVIKIASHTNSSIGIEDNFKDFIPILMVNNNPSAYYVIPVNDFPQRQTVEVNILNNHLIPGENNLEAIFKWKGKKYYCIGYGCYFSLEEIYFKNTPPLLYEFTIRSSPASADIYLDGIFLGKTPKKIETTKGWHKIKIEKLGYLTEHGDFKVYEDKLEYRCALKKAIQD